MNKIHTLFSFDLEQMLGPPGLERQQLMVVELLVFVVDELLDVLLGQGWQMGNVQMLALRTRRRLEVNWNCHCIRFDFHFWGT